LYNFKYIKKSLSVVLTVLKIAFKIWIYRGIVFKELFEEMHERIQGVETGMQG